MKRYIQANELDKLAEFDQLTQERGKGNVSEPILSIKVYLYNVLCIMRSFIRILGF